MSRKAKHGADTLLVVLHSLVTCNPPGRSGFQMQKKKTKKTKKTLTKHSEITSPLAQLHRSWM